MISGLLNNLLASIGVWVLLTISDSFLTIQGAKLYGRAARKHFSGSYELETEHQEDVDAFRVISFKFILDLVLYCGLLWIIYSAAYTRVFAFVWGGLFFIQIAIHLRHFQNLFVFYYANRSKGIKGQVEYERKLMLCMSSTDLLGIGFLLLMAFLFTGSLVILGGAAACGFTAVRHWLMSRKEKFADNVRDSPRL